MCTRRIRSCSTTSARGASPRASPGSPFIESYMNRHRPRPSISVAVARSAHALEPGGTVRATIPECGHRLREGSWRAGGAWAARSMIKPYRRAGHANGRRSPAGGAEFGAWPAPRARTPGRRRRTADTVDDKRGKSDPRKVSGPIHRGSGRQGGLVDYGQNCAMCHGPADGRPNRAAIPGRH